MSIDNKSPEDIKVTWSDVKKWRKVMNITYMNMLKKFYPHFRGIEKDLKQEMTIALIKGIRRMKKGEIRSDVNYMVTTLKGAAYRFAKKIIAYDNTFQFLEDIPAYKNEDKIQKNLEWQGLFDMGVIPYEAIFSTFTEEGEKLILLHLLEVPHYSRCNISKRLKIEYSEVIELENRVKEKLAEIIKMYTN